MTERREFLRKASLLAAGSVAAGPLLAQGGAPAAQPAAQFDMSWTERVTGRYKMAFDAHQISEGVCLHQVRSVIAGYKSVYGLEDRDVSAVLVIRHAAIPMALGDELWADGKFGADESLVDPATNQPTKRNPFLSNPAGGGTRFVWPDGALDPLISRGVIVLACDLALRNVTGRVAAARAIPRQDALALVYRHLIPGITVQPTGVFATAHAQQLGCGVLNAV
jgi:hypothetical protein